MNEPIEKPAADCLEASAAPVVAQEGVQPPSEAQTELLRAQSKAAQRVRARAHAARYQQLMDAISAAEADPDVMKVRQELEQINSAFNSAALLRDLEIAGLQARIGELQKRVDFLAVMGVPQDLIAHRSAALSRWNVIKARSVARAESRFPDMQGNARFSPEAWHPPQEVLEAMEEARRRATVANPVARKRTVAEQRVAGGQDSSALSECS